jgi:bifunctional non-homologous end joining protein LigD
MTSRRRERVASGKLPIAVSHSDKVFWPGEGYTKLDLVEYYNEILPKLAPYVEDSHPDS